MIRRILDACAVQLGWTAQNKPSPQPCWQAGALRVATKAQVIEHLAVNRPAEARAWYFAWHLQAPVLRDHLGPRGCVIQLKRLRALGSGAAMLEWIAAVVAREDKALNVHGSDGPERRSRCR